MSEKYVSQCKDKFHKTKYVGVVMSFDWYVISNIKLFFSSWRCCICRSVYTFVPTPRRTSTFPWMFIPMPGEQCVSTLPSSPSFFLRYLLLWLWRAQPKSCDKSRMTNSAKAWYHTILELSDANFAGVLWVILAYSTVPESEVCAPEFTVRAHYLLLITVAMILSTVYLRITAQYSTH